MLDVIVRIVLGSLVLGALCALFVGLVLIIDWFDHRSQKIKDISLMVCMLVLWGIVAYLAGAAILHEI